MSRKIYKTAQGKSIDLGSLLLQNEAVRAVGNMNVNARGDLLDSGNQVIDRKNRQIQRQHKRQTVSGPTATVHTSTVTAKQARQPVSEVETTVESTVDPFTEKLVVEKEPAVVVETPEPTVDASTPPGGLAAAIARSRAIKQELEKTPRQRAQEDGLKKI